MKEEYMRFIKNLQIKNFVALFFAGIINSIGVTIFLQPVGLFDSGISGTSMFLSQITPQKLTLSVFLVILNLPIFIFGAKKLSITVGTFVMIYNVILYVICGIVFSSWILPLYSIVAYVVALKTVDYFIEGLHINYRCCRYFSCK